MYSLSVLCETQFWCPKRQQAKDIINFLNSLDKIAVEFLPKHELR